MSSSSFACVSFSCLLLFILSLIWCLLYRTAENQETRWVLQIPFLWLWIYGYGLWPTLALWCGSVKRMHLLLIYNKSVFTCSKFVIWFLPFRSWDTLHCNILLLHRIQHGTQHPMNDVIINICNFEFYCKIYESSSCDY